MNTIRTYVAALALVAVATLTACQPPTSSQLGGQENVEWSCVRYSCADYGTGIEWAEQNCQQTQNGTYCPIVRNGQQFAVPLDQMNLTAITESQSYCKQYRCVRESPSRAVNYTVNQSDLGAQPTR